MSFYVRYEDRLGHDLSANGTSVLHINEIGHFPGYGLFTLVSNTVTVGAAILRQMLQSGHQDRIGALPGHLRRDIGLAPINSNAASRLYYDQGAGYL